MISHFFKLYVWSFALKPWYSKSFYLTFTNGLEQNIFQKIFYLNFKSNKVVRISFLTFFRQIVLEYCFKIWALTLLNYTYDHLLLSNPFLKRICLTFTNVFEWIETASYLCCILFKIGPLCKSWIKIQNIFF